MTCPDAREQLSALLDEALSAPERQALEAHLAACAECRRELEQLRGTVALLGRLPPIHAPAGFVDQVMDRAYRPSWPRRLLDALFRPLRVKLPLEAAAVLLVGVSALYVYQHAPEVRSVARQEARESPAAPVAPVPPGTAPGAGAGAREGGEASALKDPGLQAKRAPAEQETARERTAPPSLAPVTPPVPSVAPAPAAPRGNAVEAPPAKAGAQPGLGADLRRQAAPEAKKEAQAEGRSDAGGTASPLGATGKVAQSAEPSPARDAAGARPPATSMTAETAAPSAGLVAPAPETQGSAGGLATPAPAATPESRAGDALAPAKSRSAARLMRAVDASGRLRVPEREGAEVALDALLSRLGATRVARRLEGPQGMVLIDVVVSAGRYPELIEGLGRLGRWTTEHEPKALPPEVRVEVAVTVEP